MTETDTRADAQAREYRAAQDAFRVMDNGASRSAVYASAEAKTGSRYAVVISELPLAARQAEGGTHLITLLQPWQACMVFSPMPGEKIHVDYVAEKLCPRDRPRNMVHGGDVAGAHLTVNYALDLATRLGLL